MQFKRLPDAAAPAFQGKEIEAFIIHRKEYGRQWDFPFWITVFSQHLISITVNQAKHLQIGSCSGNVMMLTKSVRGKKTVPRGVAWKCFIWPFAKFF